MSTQTQIRRKTVTDIAKAKGGEPLVCLTAYDAQMAHLLDPYCDILLVGDSLGMVVHGLPSTVGVTMEMMILHGQAVMRGAERAFIVVDMPFGSYETNSDQAFLNAARIMQETGCQAVKIESGRYAARQIEHMVARGIPVMGHVGLRPQAINVDGGFRAKGRTQEEWSRALDEAIAADEAGAFAIVVEGVSPDLADQITSSVKCPTIGIGASASCDGQILVTNDMLGMTDWVPKFVKKNADLKSAIESAATAYAQEVKARTFPGADQTYKLRKAAKS
ncbi:MAG: 3-methyl-2-oxobutanoate hydroxymethyltransferase [Pseudomonadota bacterium]